MSSYPVYKKLVVEKIEITNMSEFQPLCYGDTSAKLCIATSPIEAWTHRATEGTDDEVDISADVANLTWVNTIDIGNNFRSQIEQGMPGQPFYIDVSDFDLDANKKVHLFLYWKHNGVAATSNEAGSSGGGYRAFRRWGNTEDGTSDDLNITYGNGMDGYGYLLRFRMVGYYSE